MAATYPGGDGGNGDAHPEWAEAAGFQVPRHGRIVPYAGPGGTADRIQRSLGSLPRALQGTGAVIVGTVHDAILVDAPEDCTPEVAFILKPPMEQAGQTSLARVPVVADGRIASRWAIF